MTTDEQSLALAHRLVGTIAAELATTHPTVRHVLDLSRTVDGWQMDVWRGDELEMRTRGDINLVSHRLAEWGGVI